MLQVIMGLLVREMDVGRIQRIVKSKISDQNEFFDLFSNRFYTCTGGAAVEAW